MAMLDWNLQKVKSNKEESRALGDYVKKITPLMFGSLKTGDELGELKPIIEGFVT
jgi:hypothetical protein